jgi:hypothetical protein
VDKNGGKLNLMNKITIGYNSEFDKDKASRIINEHREGIDQLTKRQDESTTEPITYEDLLVSPEIFDHSSQRSQGRTSQPNEIKIKIPMIDNKMMPKISLASISCTQQNRNEEDISQKETTTHKDQIQELTTKYIPPHLKG